MKFRKKPVVIDAIQWTGDNLGAVREFAAPEHIMTWLSHLEDLSIPTLEGSMIARVGDWIIRGVKGELYPCKPDIFDATYDAVE